MEHTGASCCVRGGRSLVAAAACVCEADDGLKSHTGLPRQTDLTAASSVSSASSRERRTGEGEQASRRAGEADGGGWRVSGIYLVPVRYYPISKVSKVNK